MIAFGHTPFTSKSCGTYPKIIPLLYRIETILNMKKIVRKNLE